MNPSITHLSEVKQKELNDILDIIRGVTDVEKIILFGSHATGKWIEDVYEEDGVTYEYISDYDILIITRNDETLKMYEIWDMVENRYNSRTRTTPLNTIAHNIDYINTKLSIGQYFFTDIIKEGILLYDAKRVEFAECKELSIEEQKTIAQEHFEQWFESANAFFEDFEHNFIKGVNKMLYYNKAAFELHQATERYYMCILLVLTNYKPKTHNLLKLKKNTKRFSKELYNVFPLNTKQQKDYFDKLQKAYIDARYSKTYLITKEELEYLAKRVSILKDITEKICKEKIGNLNKIRVN